MSILIPGQVQGFDRIRAPKSDWRAGGLTPVGATGMSPRTSLFNLQERRAAAPNSFLPQNVATRVPSGWATNPLSAQRPTMHPGNGGFGGGSAS